MAPAAKKRPGRPSEVKKLREEVEDLKSEISNLVAALAATQSSREVVEDRPRQVAIPQPEVPTPAPPPPAKKAVVFHSPHKNFQQRIVPGAEIVKSNGESRIVPPRYVDFSPLGSARVTDLEDIKLMRAIKEENDRRGRPTPWVEVSDEFADLKPVESIKSATVTVDTPLEELVS